MDSNNPDEVFNEGAIISKQHAPMFNQFMREIHLEDDQK